jgi:membrane protease YdiL (CAAX protease family)
MTTPEQTPDDQSREEAPPPPPLIMARPILFPPPPPPPLPSSPPPPPFGYVGSALRAVAELFILTVVFIVVSSAAMIAFYLGGLRDHRWLALAGTAAIEPVLLLAIVLIVRHGGRPLSTIGWRSDFLALDVGLGIGLTLIVFAFFAFVTVLLYIFAPHVYYAMEQTSEAIRKMFPRMSPPLLLLMAAWVAVFEETLFRGFLLTRIHAILPLWPPTVLLGALLFALPHYYEGRIAVMAIFILGLLMGTVFVRRRSLVPVIVLHFLFDAVELMLLYMTSPDWT